MASSQDNATAGLLMALLQGANQPPSLGSEWRKNIGWTQGGAEPLASGPLSLAEASARARAVAGDPRRTDFVGSHGEYPFSPYDLTPEPRFTFDPYEKEPEPEEDPEEPGGRNEEDRRGGGEGAGHTGDGFTDMRDPGFWGKDSFPGTPEGSWLGVPAGAVTSEMMNAFGTFKGGLLNNLLSGNKLSTYASRGGQAAIEAAAEALGVDVGTARAAMDKAFGIGEEREKVGGVLGSLLGDLGVFGNMAPALADNIKNERATIAGVMGALANPSLDFGSWMGTETNPYGAPRHVSAFLDAVRKEGLTNPEALSNVQSAALQAALSSYDNLSLNPPTPGFMKQLFEMERLGGIAGQIARGEGLHEADVGRIASEVPDPKTGKSFSQNLHGWANNEVSTDELSDSFESMQGFKSDLREGSSSSPAPDRAEGTASEGFGKGGNTGSSGKGTATSASKNANGPKGPSGGKKDGGGKTGNDGGGKNKGNDGGGGESKGGSKGDNTGKSGGPEGKGDGNFG